MKSRMFKSVSVLLSVMLVVALIPFGVFAKGEAPASDWGEPQYVWADDYSKCTATLECIATPDESVTVESVSVDRFEYKAATCEDSGYAKYRAVFNDTRFTTQETTVNYDALRHNWGEWVVEKEASETEPGLKKRVCKNDPTHYETEVIPVTKLNYKVWVNGVQLSTDKKEVACGSGKASYNSTTNTLILDNAVPNTAYEYTEGKKALVYSEVSKLKIMLKGKSTLNLAGNPEGIVATGDVEFIGDGSLDILNSHYGIYVEGSVVFDAGDVTVKDGSWTGLWAGKDVMFNNGKIFITTGSRYAGAMNSNIGGTVTVDGAEVEVSSHRAALHFGGGDDDSSEHAFVMKSGSFKAESSQDYGIFVYNYRDPGTGDTSVKGKVVVEGGTLDITSSSGATNVNDIEIGDNMVFIEGENLSESGRVVLSSKVMSFKLWVNGEQLTTEKTEVECGEGKAVFDTTNKILTLENAEITKSYDYDPANYKSALIYSELENLTIELKGNNTLTSETGADAVTSLSKNLIVKGGGKLDVSSVNCGFRVGHEGYENGNIKFDSVTIYIDNCSSTGIWANKDIDFTDSRIDISTGKYANAIFSNIAGTVTVTNSDIAAGSTRATLRFGGGDEDSSEHKLVMNSGTLTLESGSDYGVMVWNYRDYDDTEKVFGTLEVNGGMVDITSLYGACNIPQERIVIADDMFFTMGKSFADSERVVVKSKDLLRPHLIQKKEATCTEDGVKAHFADGDLCFEDSMAQKPIEDTATLVIPKIGHKWSKPTYNWDDDNRTVTAMVYCENDPGHIETETVDYAVINIGGPSCESEGTMLDIANFTNELFDKQVKRTHTIPAKGHDWGEPEYEWADDGSSCTAKAVCKNDSEHVITEVCENIEKTTELGYTSYKAVFENEIFGEQLLQICEPDETETLAPPITAPYEETTVAEETTEPQSTTVQVEPTETAPQATTTATESTTKAANATKSVTPAKKPAPNPVKVNKAKTKKISYSKLLKKKQKVKLVSIKNARGTVKVVKVRKGTDKKIFKKIKVNPKNGKITFAKGKYAKKKYKIRLKISVSGNKDYKARKIYVNLKVKIK